MLALHQLSDVWEQLYPVERQRLIIRKAEFTQQRLMFFVGALRQLLEDEHFTTLLRAEGLDTLPKYLAERVWSGGQPA